MRLTITRKIAVAVIGIVALSIGTMVWLSSQNLQRGFISYLNSVESQELDELAGILADEYRERGSLESIRHRPSALRALINKRTPRYEEPPLRDDDPIGDNEGPPGADGRPLDRPPPPPPPNQGRPPGPQRDLNMPQPPPYNPNRPQGLPPPANQTANRPARAERPQQPDPWGFGPRLSMSDDMGHPLFGPPSPPTGNSRRIEVDGKLVGVLNLMPLKDLSRATDSSFVRDQIRAMLWLGTALIAVATLLAIWLARQLLRPVAALRGVTKRIARGELDARAPVLNRDELAELAEHVNSMAESLEQNEQQRRRMLADVSHELRTPLTVIRGELEALLDGIRQADRNALVSLHSETLRLAKLVDDLYQLALVDAGDMQYQHQQLDLALLMREVANRYQGRAAVARLRLDTDLPSQPVSVQGDADRLTQVFSNLMENSLRYTDAEGRLLLALHCKAGMAVVALEDSAPGVPQAALARLFERLYRVDQARSRAHGGSGLGLAICKALVVAHGGSIEAQASGLGGVRMVVRLPLAS
jgi:two-component system sensor histidine kinase BaeS